jgi:hypothetical protein
MYVGQQIGESREKVPPNFGTTFWGQYAHLLK